MTRPRATVALDSPVGRLAVSAADDHIVALSWDDEPTTLSTPLLDEALRQLDAYFAGRRETFDLPLAPAGSGFQRAVWQAMQRIPYGETRCYGEIAAETQSGPRAVGGACGANPIPIIIPCHRVVAQNGRVGGYSGGQGAATKRFLLNLEDRAGLR